MIKSNNAVSGSLTPFMEAESTANQSDSVLLFDLSQIVVSGSLESFSVNRRMIDLDLLRHITLNQILSVRKKIGTPNSETVLCIDSRRYWRKERFPYYKGNRKKQRDLDKFNWDLFFTYFDQIKSEFRQSLPFTIIEVMGAEADDVISVLARRFADRYPTIVSSDKDFLQLQMISKNIRQYSPYHGKLIQADHNGYSLFEHVVRGDSGDGIPNILSDDDTLVTEGKRMRPVTSKKVEQWKEHGFRNPEMLCESKEIFDRFMRNWDLIDLTRIPPALEREIVQAYDQYEPPKSQLFNYLMKHKLKKIMEMGGF